MQNSRKVYFFASFVMLAMACAIPAVSLPNESEISTAAAETVLAGLTQNTFPVFTATNAPAASATYTPTLIYPTARLLSETPTNPPPSISETATPPPAAITQEPVFMTVTRPTHCRSGPGKSFEIVGSVLEGMKAKVLGRDTTGQYWYIENPYVYTEYCWAWGEYAEFTGNYLILPVVTSPPTPTATLTTTPSINFKLQMKGAQSCNGLYWVNLEIVNLSENIFNSARVEIIDLSTNTTRSKTYEGFSYRIACEKTNKKDQILAEASGLVSGPEFEYNLHGREVEAFITVCTGFELKGTCTTKSLKFTP